MKATKSELITTGTVDGGHKAARVLLNAGLASKVVVTVLFIGDAVLVIDGLNHVDVNNRKVAIARALFPQAA